MIFWPQEVLTSLLQNLVTQQYLKTVPSLDSHEPHSQAADHTRSSARTSFEKTAENNHDEQKKKLLTHLEPILPLDGSDSCTILVCWGKSNCCEIFPVQIALSADGPAEWRAIREAWYRRRGSWRKHIPMFGVRGVEMVKISILGDLCRPKSQSTYSGIYKCVANELEIEEKCLRKTITKSELYSKWLGNEYDSLAEFASYCVADDWVHSSDYPYPRQGVEDMKRKLNRLPLRAAFLDAFLNPDIVGKSHLLDQKLIMGQRDILEKLNEIHCPDLCDLDFSGLLIREDWGFDSRHVILPLAVTLLLALVGVSRIVYGDWSTAWTFGGFLVSFITLIWMWAHHAVG
ncbi:hypothetical protein K449DRAFT_468383 [Hypoxylon sp. EC38]|nr:hypothetical protein K449DRAFT_468383 [Hypoxylon sp. EC38]